MALDDSTVPKSATSPMADMPEGGTASVAASALSGTEDTSSKLQQHKTNRVVSRSASIPTNAATRSSWPRMVSLKKRQPKQQQPIKEEEEVEEEEPITCLAALEQVWNDSDTHQQGGGETNPLDPERILRRCHGWLSRLDPSPLTPSRDHHQPDQDDTAPCSTNSDTHIQEQGTRPKDTSQGTNSEWIQLLTRVLVSPRVLASTRRRRRRKTTTISSSRPPQAGAMLDENGTSATTQEANPLDDPPQERERQRQQRLNDIQFQVLLRLVLWKLHGRTFVQSYHATTRDEKETEETDQDDQTVISKPPPQKKRKHKSRDTKEFSSKNRTSTERQQEEYLLDDLRSILSMGSFTLSQHESFVEFFTKCLPPRFLQYPQLLTPSQPTYKEVEIQGPTSKQPPKAHTQPQPQSVLLYLCELFELTNPYQEIKDKNEETNSWMDEDPRNRTSSSNNHNKALKKRKKAPAASTQQQQLPPSKKLLSSVIGSKMRYRGGHFQSNLSSISKLLDRAPPPPSATTAATATNSKRHIAPPPKTSLRLKPGLLERERLAAQLQQQAPPAPQVKPTVSKNCLRPIRINPIATTTTTKKLPSQSDRSSTTITHSVARTTAPASPAPTKPVMDMDATPPRSNLRRRAVAAATTGTTSTTQPSQWVVAETPAKPPRPIDTKTSSSSSLRGATQSKPKRAPETPLPPSAADYQRTNRTALTASAPETPLAPSETTTKTTGLTTKATTVTNSRGHKHRDDRHHHHNDNAQIPETPVRHPLSPIVAESNNFSMAETPMPATPGSELATAKTMANHQLEHDAQPASFGSVAPDTPDRDEGAKDEMLKGNNNSNTNKMSVSARHDLVAQQLLFSPTPVHRRPSLAGGGGGSEKRAQTSTTQNNSAGPGNPRRSTINKDLLFSPTPRRARRHSIAGGGGGSGKRAQMSSTQNNPAGPSNPHRSTINKDLLFSPTPRRHSIAGGGGGSGKRAQMSSTQNNPVGPGNPRRSTINKDLLFSPTFRRARRHSIAVSGRRQQPPPQKQLPQLHPQPPKLPSGQNIKPSPLPQQDNLLFSLKPRRRHSFAGPSSQLPPPPQQHTGTIVTKNLPTTKNLLFSPTPRRLSNKNNTLWRSHPPHDTSMDLRL